ncbi:MAG: hypothetical protein QXN08_08805 [Nitrososphaerales archaeon]|jgi:CRISPR type IV-associated protein Csf3
MEPLKVTVKLKTPIGLGFPWIHFDALLAHLLVKIELGEEYYRLPTKIPRFFLSDPQMRKEINLPLKTYKDIYVASVSIINGDPVTFNYYKKGDFPFPRGKIRRGSGFFKDFNLKTVYIPAEKVVFYATGEKKEIEWIMKHLPAIGKERNIGFGFVKEVIVEEAEEEYGLTKDGMCMRPIPVKYLSYYEDTAWLSYKPPYWSKDTIDLCGVPFTRCELKS